MPDAVGAVLSRLDASQAEALDRLFALLRIPSVSADPYHKGDCRLAAKWCHEFLERIGFCASLRETAGNPLVIGHWKHPDPSRAHVTFYGHYDVQPADPLELWKSAPFEPQLINDHNNGEVIVARGAADDKGQLMTFLEACRSWHETAGSLPLSVTVILEGEEETGSSSLISCLRGREAALVSDLLLVCDTPQWTATRPAIITSLRGLARMELTVVGPDRDLHSGIYGGAATNPIRELTRLLAKIYDEDGVITIPGFYDGIIEPSCSQLDEWKVLEFDEKRFLGDVGLTQPAGERKRSVLEQIWSRPTAEINGIYGGYTGHGSKTIVPSEVTAKISFRLVPGQNPASVLNSFREFVSANLGGDCKAAFRGLSGEPGVGIDTSMPAIGKAQEALQAEWGVSPVKIGCGGSIPVVESFKTELDMDALLVGFGVEDDRVHAPNEKYNLLSFTKGARSWARILHKLAECQYDRKGNQ